MNSNSSLNNSFLKSQSQQFLNSCTQEIPPSKKAPSPMITKPEPWIAGGTSSHEQHQLLLACLLAGWSYVLGEQLTARSPAKLKNL
jgi:hypothetical protein